MPILWHEVAARFDEAVEGRLPDGLVRGTTPEDWASVLQRYHELGWSTDDDRPDGGRLGIDRLFAAHATLVVRPGPGVRIHLFAWRPDEIPFDVDAREVHDQSTLDLVCRFMAVTGRRLARPVELSPEGVESEPFLRYDVAGDALELCP